MFESVNNLPVAKNRAIFAFNNKASPSLSKYSSYFYRGSIGFEDIQFDNTLADDIKFLKRLPKQTSKSVNISCRNDSFRQDGLSSDDISNIEIVLSEIPNTSIAINVVKRNITKKEKEFKIIKNYDQNENFSNQSKTDFYELKDQQTLFFKRKGIGNISSRKYKFIDHDVEIGDVYEYKALLYDNNCVTSHSANSLIYQYEERKKIIDISIADINSNDVSGKLDKDFSFAVNVSLNINVKKDVFDEIFESLDRNSYETFSKEFEDIKESLKKNVSCIVNLVNKNTSEKIEIGIFNDIKEGILSFSFEIEDSYSEYCIEVIPRVASLSQVVENVLNKMERLPIIQKSFPINTFYRNLTVKRNIAASQLTSPTIKLSEKSVDKYTGRSIRLFGLILDEVTRFNKEKDDFYFEGTTGDNYYFDVHVPKQLKTNDELRFLNFQDLSYQTDYSSSENIYKKIGILRLRSPGKSNIVNFHALYSKSNGTLNFLGLITPDDFGKNTYNFAVDLEEEIGIIEIYNVSVLKNGNYEEPDLIVTLQCSNKNIEVL